MPEFQRLSDQARAHPTSGVQWNHVLDTMKRMQEGPKKIQRDKNKVCNRNVATFNIETLTGKSTEIVDMMTMRRTDII